MQTRGFPDRRDGGSHHARGRGPAAPGRPQPARRHHHPELRGLRPRLRLRARGDRAGRPAADVCRAGERLLLHHLHERELRAPGHAAGRRAGDPEGHVPAARRWPRQGACQPVRLGHDPARGARGRRPAREGVRRAGRRVQRHELLGAAARGARRRALEHAAPGPAAPGTLRPGLSRRPRGPVRRGNRLLRIVADQVREWVPGRYHVLGTDGYGRSDSRAALRISSRSTAAGSPWPRSRRSPTRGGSTPRR